MMPANTIQTETQARDYVASLSDRTAFERLRHYVDMLLLANKQQNLISKRTVPIVWQRHIADSAQLIGIVSRETLRLPWLDLGSGAGLPGLVIACLRPNWNVVCIESRRRRADFLQHCVAELALSTCKIVEKRVERTQPFDAGVISARAFAPLDKLLRLSAPFSTSQTIYVLPKGQSASQGVYKLPNGRAMMFHVKQSRTEPSAGIMVGEATTRGQLPCLP